MSIFYRRHSVDRESCAPTHVRAGRSVTTVPRWFDWVTQESVVPRSIIHVLSTRAHTVRLGLCLVMFHDFPGSWPDLALVSPAHSSLCGRPKVSIASNFPVSTERRGAFLLGRQDAFDGEAFLSWNPGLIRRNPSLILQVMATLYRLLLQQDCSTYARDGKLRARYLVYMDESSDLLAGLRRDNFCLIAQNSRHASADVSPSFNVPTRRSHPGSCGGAMHWTGCTC